MPEMTFFIAKALSSLLSPLPFTIVLLIIGSVLLWFTNKQKAGKIFVSGATVILLLISYGFISNRLLKPLEYYYPQFNVTTIDNKPSVKWVVVLAGGHTPNPDIPVTSRISSASMVRLTEGVRLYRELPGSKIILAGGAVFDTVPEVEISARIAEIMNVKRSDLVLEKMSKDTEDQAQFIKKFVGNDRFVLVTSASHMPRSMAIFKKVGLNPIPAPTHYQVVERQNSMPGDFFPSIDALSTARTAIYEYLCMCWSKLRNKI
jgi:uncharacterized SAM-binding protein YcdF (DUF218 family)